MKAHLHLLYLSLAVGLFCSCAGQTDRQAQHRDSIAHITIGRFDVLQTTYVTTGDYSALQQMSLHYPTETRTLIEDVLQLGQVTDYDINARLLNFYQDSVLMQLTHDVQQQFSDLSPIELQLRNAFTQLRHYLPDIPIPTFYAQIGSLKESIVVNENRVGISLEKYLGSEYPLYVRYYMPTQRAQMTPDYIVPDCLCFFLLSRYPLARFSTSTQRERDLHIAKIQWLANQCVGQNIFRSPQVNLVEKYMKRHAKIGAEQLMQAAID